MVDLAIEFLMRLSCLYGGCIVCIARTRAVDITLRDQYRVCKLESHTCQLSTHTSEDNAASCGRRKCRVD